MFYAIIGRDVEDSLEKRRAARPDHLRRLHELREQARLLLAGPFPAIDGTEPGDAGFTGSLIVAAFDTLKQATEWAQSDPYVKAGIYKEVSVLPFKKVLP